MTRFFFTILVLLVVNEPLKAQNDCFYISSILVDACGTPEGPNEMIRLQIGNEPLDWNTMTINFPNNNFLGICQNPQTAANVQALNSTILSCGLFKEPENNLLPANADVLIVTSVNFDPSAHDYSGLTDTIYILFQCEGNIQGHFANWINNCVENNGNRTTTVSFANGCSSTATYNRCLLINQTGGIGGTAAERDGARVDFSPSGDVTYANDGCTIDLETATVSISVTATAVCVGDEINASAQLTGNTTTNSWSSTSASFSNDDALNTTITFPTAGNYWVTFTTLNNCNTTIQDSVLIQVNDIASVAIIVNEYGAVCTQGDVELTASSTQENTDFIWSNASSDVAILPDQEGWWYLSGTSACGTGIDSVLITFGDLPSCEITSPDTIYLCEGEQADVQLVSGNADNIIWSNGSTANNISIASEGWVTVTVSNECGACTDSTFVKIINIDAFFTVTPNEGTAPLTVTIENTEQNENANWFVNNNLIQASGQLTFEEPGTYEITQEVVDPVSGCSDSFTVNIIVTEEEDDDDDEEEEEELNNELAILIPNVFTPNGDGINDHFGITINQAISLDYTIHNRWGNEVAKASEKVIEEPGFAPLWDGKSLNQLAIEGVYFYRITIKHHQSEQQYQGFFHLIRK